MNTPPQIQLSIYREFSFSRWQKILEGFKLNRDENSTDLGQYIERSIKVTARTDDDKTISFIIHTEENFGIDFDGTVLVKKIEIETNSATSSEPSSKMLQMINSTLDRFAYQENR